MYVFVISVTPYRYGWIGVNKNSTSKQLLWQIDQSPVVAYRSKFRNTDCHGRLSLSGMLRPVRCRVRRPPRAAALCEKEATCDESNGK